MPNLSPEFAVHVLTMLVTILATGGAIYGGIRADLKGMHERLGRVEAGIDQARERMDNHIERSHA